VKGRAAGQDKAKHGRQGTEGKRRKEKKGNCGKGNRKAWDGQSRKKERKET